MENKEKLENQEELDNEGLPEDFVDIYDVSDLEVKPAWQAQKEEWYSHLNISVKQLDAIIGLGIAGLIIVFIMIGLDAAGIF